MDAVDVLKLLPADSGGLVAIAVAVIYLAKLIRAEMDEKRNASVHRLGKRLGVQEELAQRIVAALANEDVHLPPAALPADDADVDDDELVDHIKGLLPRPRRPRQESNR